MAANALSSRATRTRQALLAAGLELLVERPIDAIPIDDLVTAAGVAKGSFFNHFADKQAFAAAVSAFVREDLEARVTAANAGIADPVERLAGGMAVAAAYARAEPRRTVIMLRGLGLATARDHPLNRGVAADIAACIAAGAVRPEAASSGVLYWLGLCHALVINMVERRHAQNDAALRLSEVMLMGLAGLGIDPGRAKAVAAACAARAIADGGG